MKSFLLSLLSASLLFLPQGVFGAAEALAPAPVKDKYPKPPKLEFLYTVNITGGETYNVGNGPNGLRLVVPILNGTFAGPRLKGTVVPAGGDWALFRKDNTLVADVRQTFKTVDGAYIQVFETGVTQPDNSSYVRLTFETGYEKYTWLNSVVAVGILRLVEGGGGSGGLRIDTWLMAPN
ncbi:unnamed protein product [Sordaria macrospora k-hell]|uniref:WGS project CABT00000000 data, contig 2.22 n=1 Tax=Sordaria macrospora (strain ATCC MYA-333 / DSM 997 / K(L3346) / K-hell) TaxID=771870 RepID=F7W2K4_SORMK|nr:uncharacterized protein SMAC_05068 [Sordaria macrospora k-hell]KAH7632559.1 hypothetical protein B0T09DRAFT_76084 [Sordaria sp. MPI-SDFR-AT-0083]CCC11855.1 unnamed protein product [Sordaria macrospora k-hell]